MYSFVLQFGHLIEIDIIQLSLDGNNSNPRFGEITAKLSIRAQIGIIMLISLFFGFCIILAIFAEYRIDRLSSIFSRLLFLFSGLLMVGI
jgi:hypothetical protein